MRAFGFLYANIRGLHTAAYVIAGLTLGAQLTALVRDRIFAHQFGAGRELDLFYAAFRVPDLLFALTASLVSIFALIPYIQQAQEQGTPAVRVFLSEMFTLFSVMLASVAGMVVLFAPELVTYAYGAFTSAEQETLVSLLRILLLQPILLGISNLCAAYVQVRKRFVLYATAPILYNVGIIAGSLFLYPHLGLLGLGWGVVLGAMLHFGIQAPFMIREHVFPVFARPNWQRVKEVVLISIPRSLTLSAQQITLFVLVAIASSFSAGSVTVFSFAANLSSVPLALIASGYSVAAFPELARFFREGKTFEFSGTFGAAMRAVIFWSLPTTALFLALNQHAVTVLLGTGAFDHEAIMLTATVLSILTCSLVAQSLSMLIVRMLYATNRTLVPLMCTATGTVFTLCVAYLFASFPVSGHATFFKYTEGIFGVALAYVLGAFCTMALLLWSVRASVRTLVPSRVVLGSALASYALYAFSDGTVAILRLSAFGDLSPLNACIQGVFAALAGLFAWAVVLRLFRSEELEVVWHAVKSSLRPRSHQ